MDNEIDVIYELKKNPISINGNNLNNYIFVDSKMDTMVQLSDNIKVSILYWPEWNGLWKGNLRYFQWKSVECIS